MIPWQFPDKDKLVTIVNCIVKAVGDLAANEMPNHGISHFAEVKVHNDTALLSMEEIKSTTMLPL